jgi:hypothetical protein
MHGLGDLIFGLLTVVQESKKKHIRAFLSIERHSLNNYIQSNRVHWRGPISAYEGVFHEHQIKRLFESEFVFTNKKPEKHISQSDCDFIRMAFLNYNPETRQRLNLERVRLEVPRVYDVVHLRFGDEEMRLQDQKVALFAQLLEELNKLPLKADSTVYLSDSERFQAYLTARGFLAPLGVIEHIGEPVSADASLFKTLFDFDLLLRARSIFQASAYQWGSGFSASASILSGSKIVNLDKVGDILKTRSGVQN